MSSNRSQTTACPGAVRMTARAATALFGGYAAAAGLATLLARLAPGSRVEASVWGMVLSFLLYAGVGLWAFHERRLWVVASGIWGLALLTCGAALMLGMRP